ncbi:NUDIX domain-containing protein [Filimonas effusa]|uniref:NUDIX domain-containing protein n=1 Tax=Filimonas effusa TaxID=2508721 RepID=A0A4Q1DAZ0_9BACT|nr:NUDIX domain-containing protein [Filimonas effusa]RXK85935.1 NUDIX domain-containing protein [Filimonas effusa]
MERAPQFNVRVYGLLIDSARRVLVSDEFIRGAYFTKFPGGGLEFGEGTRDCLKREFMEETGLDVQIGSHIYTTDFFQISAFNNKDQIISIYYFVHAAEPVNLVTHHVPFAFEPWQVADNNGTAEAFRWIGWDELTVDTVSLPIDKVVVSIVTSGQVTLPWE